MGGVLEIRREAVTDWLDEQGIRDRSERQLWRQVLLEGDRAYVDALAEKKGKPGKPGEEGLQAEPDE